MARSRQTVKTTTKKRKRKADGEHESDVWRSDRYDARIQ